MGRLIYSMNVSLDGFVEAAGHEYRLAIHPVVIGAGTPYLPRLGVPVDLELVEARRFGSGVVLVRYAAARP